jgi:uncharacterized membrane protein YkvA (DUF1232 family)
MITLTSLKQRARDLKQDVFALYLARNDPRIPWYVKAVIVLTVAYAVSPIDLIPDFIPVLGYLDDLIIVPAGIAFAASRIPPGILEEYREQAKTGLTDKAQYRWGWAIVVLIWLIVIVMVLKFVVRPA